MRFCNFSDDDLAEFEAHGALPLLAADHSGYVEHDGACIWYASYGAEAGKSRPAVILLHGGMGNSGNWGYQLPALVDSGYRVVLIDSRGQGRSTRDERPYSYELMASDVVAVMDAFKIKKAALVGWSDGACTALILARQLPERVAGVFYFACNMDPSGTKEVELPDAVLDRCMQRHTRDYAQLSSTPGNFGVVFEAVGLMQRTQPNWSAKELTEVSVPAAVVQSERDEFIRIEHMEYLAESIPGAELMVLPGVSHFAPLQRPQLFNDALSGFLGKVLLVGDAELKG